MSSEPEIGTPGQPQPKYNFSSTPRKATPIPGTPEASPPVQGPYPTQTPYPVNNAGAEDSVAYRPSVSLAAPVDDSPPPNPLRYLVGIALGVVVGLVCAWLYGKFVFYTGFGLSIISCGIGFAVGVAVTIGSGRGGFLAGVLGGAIAFASMIYSRFLLINDHISREIGASASIPLNAETLQMTFQSLSLMGWVIVIMGASLGFVTPIRASDEEGGSLVND